MDPWGSLVSLSSWNGEVWENRSQKRKILKEDTNLWPSHACTCMCTFTAPTATLKRGNDRRGQKGKKSSPVLTFGILCTKPFVSGMLVEPLCPQYLPSVNEDKECFPPSSEDHTPNHLTAPAQTQNSLQ